jgi:hypothetical protein
VPARSAARGMMIAVLAVLAALLASPPAGALVPAGNLVVNPGAEQGSAATDEFHVFAPPSWSASAGVTQLKYGTSAFPGIDVSNQIGGGSAFFAGGPNAQS